MSSSKGGFNFHRNNLIFIFLSENIKSSNIIYIFVLTTDSKQVFLGHSMGNEN